jgi:hypothetical protein
MERAFVKVAIPTNGNPDASLERKADRFFLSSMRGLFEVVDSGDGGGKHPIPCLLTIDVYESRGSASWAMICRGRGRSVGPRQGTRGRTAERGVACMTDRKVSEMRWCGTATAVWGAESNLRVHSLALGLRKEMQILRQSST